MSEMVLENVNQDALPEYPFRFPVKVPTLQGMASHRFCDAIFRYHDFISSESNKFLNSSEGKQCYSDPVNDYAFSTFKADVDELLEGLQLPRSIEEILKRAANEIQYESKRFAHRLKYDMFDYSRGYSFGIVEVYFDFDWCTWLPHGELDFRKSVAKMLNSGRLDERQKFFAASIYCVEEQILKTISSDTIRFFTEKVKFEKEPLLFYWLCYSQNKLERVPIDEVGEMLESTMFESCPNYELSDLEYFWPRLTNDHRIYLAKRLAYLYGSFRFTTLERLFFSISSDSSASLTSRTYGFYLKSYLMNSGGSTDSSHILIMWNRFKNQITGDAFAWLFFYVFKYMLLREDSIQPLLQMWDTAYDHQIESLMERGSRHIMNDFFHYFNGSKELPCSSAYQLIYRILMQKPEEERLGMLEEFMQECIDNARIERLELFDEMLHVCLPSAHDRLLLKSRLLRSEKLQDVCVKLLEEGEHARVARSLTWLLSDRSPNAIAEYKDMILTSKSLSSFEPYIASVEKWNDLSEFIDKTYLEDDQSAINMKRILIDAATPISQYDWNFYKNFDVWRKIVEKEFPVQVLTQFKRSRLQCLVKKLDSKRYWENEQGGDQIHLQNFVEWCCDQDEESIAKFKNSVSLCVLLDAIVEKIMKSCSSNTQTSELELLLHRFDWYLKWFAGSDEKVIESKVLAIKCGTCNVKKFYLWATNEEKNLPKQQMLLSWLCGGDEAVLQKCMERRLE